MNMACQIVMPLGYAKQFLILRHTRVVIILILDTRKVYARVLATPTATAFSRHFFGKFLRRNMPSITTLHI